MSYVEYLRASAQAVTVADAAMLADPDAGVAEWMKVYLDRLADA